MMNRATDSASAGSCYQFLDLSDAGECDAATLRGLLYPSPAATRANDDSKSLLDDADNGCVSVAAWQCREVIEEGPGTASLEQHPKMVELRDAEIMGDNMKLLLPSTGNPIALNPNAQSFDPMLVMVVLPGPPEQDGAGHTTKTIANGGAMMLPAAAAPPAAPPPSSGPLVTVVLPTGTDLLLRPPVTLADPAQSQDILPAGALPPTPPLPPALLPTPPTLGVLTVVRPPICSTTSVQAKQPPKPRFPSPSSAIFPSAIGIVPTAPPPPAALPATTGKRVVLCCCKSEANTQTINSCVPHAVFLLYSGFCSFFFADANSVLHFVCYFLLLNIPLNVCRFTIAATEL
ncbi:formin-like protein 3 [Anopheles albimanus]|uniref:formin-like protein 3 n=1 Tax=Anopheles albimanus TaxID=7167 RepID=UPI00163F4E03|nr:formin-like protein 3 [Anopheles albimanus]XP_035790168.1 formin-like protein 3 [Anopheles albimanus]